VLERISRALIAFYWFGLRRPGITVAVILGAVLFMAGGLSKLHSVSAARDLFEDNTEAARNFDTISNEFNIGNPVMVAVRPRSGHWNTADLCELSVWLTRQSMGNPEIQRVASPYDLREVISTEKTIHYRRILEPCAQEPRPLEEQFSRLADTPLLGTLLAPDRSDFAFELNFRNTPGGSRRGRFDPAPIQVAWDAFEHDLGDRFVSVWSGPSMYDHYSAKGMKRFPLMNLGVLLLILLLYRVYTGSWKSGGILLLSLILTGIFIFGGMGWAHHSVDVLASTIFLMVTIAAHQDFSFVTSSQLDRPEDFRRTFRRFVVPSFFTSLTTMIGFYSLCVSDLAIIRHFGFWAGTGAFFEWIMVMVFVPSLLSLVPPLRRWTKKRSAFLARFRNINTRRFIPGQKFARVLLCLMVLAPWAVSAVNVSDDPTGLFPRSHPFRAAMNYIKQTRGWENTLDLLFAADVTPVSRAEILDKIAKLPFIGRVEEAAPLVAFLKHGLDVSDQGFVEDQINSAGILERYRTEDGRYRAILYIRSSDLIDYRAFREALSKICGPETCKVSGLVDLYSEYTYSISHTLAESLVLSLALVTLIMVFIIRSKRAPHGTLLILSSFWGPLMMLLVLAIFRIPLNVYNCNCASVLIGLTGDNAIQFVFASRRGRLEEGVGSRRDGAIFTSVVMSLGCLVFLAAAFQPPRVLGVLLFFGFLFCLAGDYWLLKGLLGPSRDEIR
jgi:predicted RND superfamily exporter protein